MRASLYAPFVGQADCFLLELSGQDQIHHLLIDGASRVAPKIDLVSYLSRQSVTALEGMLLTHLHQDHLGQLLEVAENLPVKRAVLPYPPELVSPALFSLLPEEYAEDLRCYHRLCQALNAQNTACDYCFGNADCVPFHLGGFSMRRLFPLPGDVSKTLAAAARLVAEDHRDAEENCRDYCDGLNEDSAIWLLQEGQRSLALFCGDAPVCHQKESLSRNPVRPKLLKLSHHGRNDKGRIYFDEELLLRLCPESILIPAEKARLEEGILPKAPYLARYSLLLPEELSSPVLLG